MNFNSNIEKIMEPGKKNQQKYVHEKKSRQFVGHEKKFWKIRS